MTGLIQAKRKLGFTHTHFVHCYSGVQCILTSGTNVVFMAYNSAGKIRLKNKFIDS